MGMMESSPTSIAPLLLRNVMASMFIYADKSLLTLAERYRLLEYIRYIVTTFLLFFLRFLPSFFPSLGHHNFDGSHSLKLPNNESHPPVCGGAGDSSIGRALSQLLSLVNDIPVSSRKYEVVRSLAERLIDENNTEDVEVLREVNRVALSAAFANTLGQLEAAMVNFDRVENGGLVSGPVTFRLNRVLKAVWSIGEGALVWAARPKNGGMNHRLSTCSAEKLAAELLWLAQEMVACGFGEEALCKWASASHLAWLALSAEPRLQSSLIKASAFFFKQAKDLGEGETEEGKREQSRQTKMKMLMSWLPLLCGASNGTDAPVLSTSEKAELERVLEQIIGTLEQEEEQEQVLSLWLHHFTYASSSDWPNLHASYARWCTASRKLLVLQRNKT